MRTVAQFEAAARANKRNDHQVSAQGLTVIWDGEFEYYANPPSGTGQLRWLTREQFVALLADAAEADAPVGVRLRLALHRFEVNLGRALTHDDIAFLQSARVAVAAVDGEVEMERERVLLTIRDLVGEIETSLIPLERVDEARDAYADLCKQWGYLLVDGQPSAAPVRPVHASALAGHLATLIEFHHDDDGDQQHADPILEAYHPPELSSLRLKTASGRHFMVSVIELPA